MKKLYDVVYTITIPGVACDDSLDNLEGCIRGASIGKAAGILQFGAADMIFSECDNQPTHYWVVKKYYDLDTILSYDELSERYAIGPVGGGFINFIDSQRTMSVSTVVGQINVPIWLEAIGKPTAGVYVVPVSVASALLSIVPGLSFEDEYLELKSRHE